MDCGEDGPDHRAGDGNLGKLEGDGAGVAGDFDQMFSNSAWGSLGGVQLPFAGNIS